MDLRGGGQAVGEHPIELVGGPSCLQRGQQVERTGRPRPRRHTARRSAPRRHADTASTPRSARNRTAAGRRTRPAEPVVQPPWRTRASGHRARDPQPAPADRSGGRCRTGPSPSSACNASPSRAPSVEQTVCSPLSSRSPLAPSDTPTPAASNSFAAAEHSRSSGTAGGCAANASTTRTMRRDASSAIGRGDAQQGGREHPALEHRHSRSTEEGNRAEDRSTETARRRGGPARRCRPRRATTPRPPRSAPGGSTGARHRSRGCVRVSRSST
jgi:hypothetical protein